MKKGDWEKIKGKLNTLSMKVAVNYRCNWRGGDGRPHDHRGGKDVIGICTMKYGDFLEINNKRLSYKSIRSIKIIGKEEMHFICDECNNCFYEDSGGAEECCDGCGYHMERHEVCLKCGVCKWGETQQSDCSNCENEHRIDENCSSYLKTTEVKNGS